jgi:hypothetical protein
MLITIALVNGDWDIRVSNRSHYGLRRNYR